MQTSLQYIVFTIVSMHTNYIFKNSMFSKALNGKWGRDRREVVLPRVSNPDSIGLELCGLSDTGYPICTCSWILLRRGV